MNDYKSTDLRKNHATNKQTNVCKQRKTIKQHEMLNNMAAFARYQSQY